jgi:hypothetical protein
MRSFNVVQATGSAVRMSAGSAVSNAIARNTSSEDDALPLHFPHDGDNFVIPAFSRDDQSAGRVAMRVHALARFCAVLHQHASYSGERLRTAW